MPSRRISPIVPLDPKRVIPTFALGRGDPSISLDDGAWIAINLPSGAATLRFTRHGSELDCEAWGPGAEEALTRAPGIIGAEDDPTEFTTENPTVARLLQHHPGMRITRSRLVTESLIRAVFGQKVTGKEAKRSYRKMALALGEPAPGPHPELITPPHPDRITTIRYEDFHPWGVERKRAGTILEVARRSKRLEEAADMELPEAFARLTAVRGVGSWSASIVAAQALGDADAVPVGDYNIPNLVTWVLAGEPRGDDDRMLELLEPFRPHRGRVVRLVKATGIKAPEYGPPAPLRSIEGI